MRTKKTLSTDIKAKLDHLSQESKSTYLSLFVMSDDAGMVPNTNNQNLFELCQNNLIQVTKDHIVLIGYLTSNYSKTMNPEYSPTKSVFQIIKDAGYSYNAETNEIDIPKASLLSQNKSLNRATNVQMSTNVSERLEPSPQVTKSSQSIVDVVSSLNFAFYLSIALMFAQSVHTSYSLMSLSHLPSGWNEAAAIFTAIIMDSLILYFVALGRKFESAIFFGFCALMGLYSYHLHTEWFSYNSFFAIIVSVCVPWAVHAVANQVNISNSKVFP